LPSTDPIADNAHRGAERQQGAPRPGGDAIVSAQKVELARVLKDEGISRATRWSRRIASTRWWSSSSTPTVAGRVIAQVKRVSKPGRRIYAKKDNLPKVLGGLGTAVISTSRGLMTAREAQSWASAAKSSVSSGSAMSRIGRAPITIPSGVDVTLAGQQRGGQGSQGAVDSGSPSQDAGGSGGRSDDRQPGPMTAAPTGRCTASPARSSPICNGVTTGFEKRSGDPGVGYRASKRGADLEILVGYSHPVVIPLRRT